VAQGVDPEFKPQNKNKKKFSPVREAEENVKYCSDIGFWEEILLTNGESKIDLDFGQGCWTDY
jgi:hypothetical protein